MYNLPIWAGYLIVAALLVLAEVLYFWVAMRFGIVDRPNLRSSHSHVTLRGGGVVFLIAMVQWWLFYGFHYPLFMAGLASICIVSFIDDIHSVPNCWRLVVQFISMMLMFIDLGIVNDTLWWAIIPALIVCVGIINAYNFMDGINGITGGYSLAVLIPLAILNGKIGFIEQSLINMAIIAVLIFCFFNFRKKAKCFAGDVGAVGIAFIILFILGKLIITTGQVQYLLLLSVYGIDTVLTILHRIKLRENLGQAHRKHAYQLMANELHIPHTVVSLFYFTLQLVISLILIFIPDSFSWPYSIVVLLLLSGAYILFVKKYYHLHEEYLLSRQKVK